ncbi:MAG TPA: histidine--tRNA ligase [Candidatus Paceibacterota bacterium]
MQKAKTKVEKVKKSLEGPYQSPKGMRDLMGEELYAFQGFAEKAAEVAIYYGFTPIETPILEQEEVFIRGVGVGTEVVDKELYTLRTKGGDHLALRPEYTAGVMRAYIEHGMQSLPQPVMLYSSGKLYRHDKPQKGRYREYHTFNLEVLGSEKAINDAMVIKMFRAILEEVGLKNLSLRLNSIGDKDCRPNYRRELVNYYRKNLGKVCADCIERFKVNPLRLLDCKESQCQDIKSAAPDSISYLCEPCKSHFKEVLEYIEGMGIEYTIDHTLVRGLDYYTRTVFEICPVTKTPDGNVEGASLGGGGRYDYLAKILGSNKPVPAVGVGLGTDRIVDLIKNSGIAPRILKKPKVFFIQLGYEAKLKSVGVIEILREARISIAHSISKDSLSSQLSSAEKMNIPYCLILGQREVMDNTVIVRDMETRSQKSVLLSNLPTYIRELKGVAKK